MCPQIKQIHRFYREERNMGYTTGESKTKPKEDPIESYNIHISYLLHSTLKALVLFHWFWCLTVPTHRTPGNRARTHTHRHSSIVHSSSLWNMRIHVKRRTKTNITWHEAWRNNQWTKNEVRARACDPSSCIYGVLHQYYNYTKSNEL